MLRPIPALLTGAKKSVGAPLPTGRVTTPTRATPKPATARAAPARPAKATIVHDHAREEAARLAALIAALVPASSGRTTGVMIDLLKRLADEGIHPDPSRLGGFIATMADGALDDEIPAVVDIIHHLGGPGFHVEIAPLAATAPEKATEPGSGIWDLEEGSPAKEIAGLAAECKAGVGAPAGVGALFSDPS